MSGLHFHDLQHEATSRLFEKGFDTMEVSTITGHKTFAQTLYTFESGRFGEKIEVINNT
ncbi:hypothetical protein ACSYAY_01165 [Leptospirillum ferriphilum]|uniref:hypothetical protein n=1 Tax=Leptospirillum ferriphilum TaxID=178606 RepID=UPI003EE537C2